MQITINNWIIWLIPFIVFVNQLPAQENNSQIDSIKIIRHNIFRPHNGKINWYEKILNSLHIVTKEKIIRNELLFQKGDIYDEDIIDETERNLRALGFIGAISLEADTLKNKNFRVTVNTSDKWTLGVDSRYSGEGGIQNFYFSFRDDNFLGNAQNLNLGYNYRSDRNNPSGIELNFTERQLFGTRWKANVGYKNSEDQDIKTFRLERTYFSESATWAGSAYFDFGKLRLRKYENGEVLKEYFLRQQHQNIWLSSSINDKPKLIFGLLYFRARTQTENIINRPIDNLDHLNFSFNVVKKRFKKTTQVDAWSEIDDITLGYSENFVIGKNFNFSINNSFDYYMQFDSKVAEYFSNKYYVSMFLSYVSFISMDNISQQTFYLNSTFFSKLNQHHTVVFNLQSVYGKNWSPSRQITLGSNTGLRGYDTYQFTGQRQILYNIEDRIFTDLKFWIFKFGGALFFDSGSMWNESESYTKMRFHSTVGFGLRIENKLAPGAGIIRIDFAYRLDDKKIAMIISSEQLFKSILDFSYIPPFLKY